MKALPLLCFAGALVLACVMAASYTTPETPSPPSITSTPATSVTSTVTPAGALIMTECAKAVLAGEQVVRPHHFAQIDNCAALVRATILAR